MKRNGFVALCFAVLLAGCGGTTSTSKPAGSSTAATTPPKSAPIDPSKSQVSGNPGMAPVDYLGTIAKGKKSAERNQALAQLKSAIQNYTIGEGSKPRTLQDLIKKGYLNDVPKIPYGMKAVYDARTGAVDIVMADPHPAGSQ